MEFDGKTLRASTRNGSDLLYDKQDLIVELYEKERGMPLKSRESWENLVKSKIFGLIQSRMYQGSWTSEEIEQCFSLTKINGSYTEKFMSRKLNVFNSSSYASYWLSNKLRSIGLKPI